MDKDRRLLETARPAVYLAYVGTGGLNNTMRCPVTCLFMVREVWSYVVQRQSIQTDTVLSPYVSSCTWLYSLSCQRLHILVNLCSSTGSQLQQKILGSRNRWWAVLPAGDSVDVRLEVRILTEADGSSSLGDPLGVKHVQLLLPVARNSTQQVVGDVSVIGTVAEKVRNLNLQSDGSAELVVCPTDDRDEVHC